jgi:hypothetical protein
MAGTLDSPKAARSVSSWGAESSSGERRLAAARAFIESSSLMID